MNKSNNGSFCISDEAEKLVMLPKQLEAVARATTIPKEVHRWNTNEVNPILDLIFMSPFILCKTSVSYSVRKLALRVQNSFPCIL